MEEQTENQKSPKQAGVSRLAVLGLMTALTTVFTILIRIPVAPTRGYLNLGDAVIYFSAFAFGPWTALISGGLGTALADIIGGYAQWAPITFFAHGLQGLLAGFCFFAGSKKNEGKLRGKTWALFALSFLAGSVAMMGLYFLFALITIGPGAALTELPGNLIQNIAGIVLGAVLWSGVRRAYPPINRFRW